MNDGPEDFDDGVVPDLEKGMGLGAWLADGEKEDASEDEPESPIEGTASAQMIPLKERNGGGENKSRMRPFERAVWKSIEEANKGRRK